MANMHVRWSDAGVVEIVCHFAIAATNNTVGTPWRRAYGQQFKPTQISILPDGTGLINTGSISAAEKALVNAAEPAVAEVILRFVFPSDWGSLSGAQRNALLDSWYANELAEFNARNMLRLNYHGYLR